MTYNTYTAKNATEAAAAWVAAAQSNPGHRYESIENELRHHVPELGELHQAWKTLFGRDMQAHTAQQPTFDTMDMDTWPVPFETQHWTQETRAARTAYEAKLREIVGA